MTSLLIESFVNKINNEGMLKDNSNIKQLLQIILESNIDNLNKLYCLENNLRFKELGTDLLTKISDNSATVYSLEKRGYKETTYDKYNFENFNYIINSEYIPIINKQSNIFINTIVLNGKEKYKEYFFFVQDDYILFAPTEANSSVEYFFKLNNYKILDFKINKANFVFMILETIDNKRLFVTSHLGKVFAQYNDDKHSLNLDECYNVIDMTDYKIHSLNHINGDYFFVCDNNSKLRIRFSKKYYFKYDNAIYFNNQGDCDDFKKSFIGTIQNNFLNMYNYLNIYGLNNFKIDNRKISTKENKIFDELLTNKFDNTLNGGLNYFNAKGIYSPKISPEIKSIYNQDKDYHINIQDEYFNIYGNFVYKFKHGKFDIRIYKNKIELISVNNNIKTVIDSVKIPNYKEFYFYNLKFTFKKFEFPDTSLTYSISSFSPYTFKHGVVENYKMFSVPNNSKVIDNIIENSNLDNKFNSNASFDGKRIKFNNYFDWSKKEYQYGNFNRDINSQEIFNLDNIKKYTFLGNSIIKDNQLFARENGKLYYSNINDFSFELINKNGYITNFWNKNQDKTIYFKKIDGQIKLIKNKFESDFYCYIPKISDYIKHNNIQYSNVYVDISDNLEVNLQLDENLLVTNKYLNNPLFYKVYIEDLDDDNIHIFDNDNQEIYNYIKTKYNNGFIYYFNIENDKKYYYNTSTSKYNYFEPIESYQNINSFYYFDETGYINFDNVKTIKSFSIKSNILIEKDIDISLFMYNTQTGDVNKISINKKDLNNKFEIDINTNKIYIDIKDDVYNKNNFFIVEDSNESLTTDEYLIFFKQTRQDIVYIAEKNPKLDFNKIDFTKLKVNTYYKIIDGNFIESNNGTFIIDSLGINEIAIIPNLYIENDYFKTNIFLTESINDIKDDFYIKNFKTPGNYYINYDINSKKIIESFNENIDGSELLS